MLIEIISAQIIKLVSKLVSVCMTYHVLDSIK